MLENDNMIDKEQVVYRANVAQNKIRFYKSYIKNITLIRQRAVPGHICGYMEQDFYFEHKGERYVICEHIKPMESGRVEYSYDYYYTLQTLRKSKMLEKHLDRLNKR